jgi:hypothetical protein
MHPEEGRGLGNWQLGGRQERCAQSCDFTTALAALREVGVADGAQCPLESIDEFLG